MQIRATLTANVTNEPEIKATANSQVKNLRLAVDHDRKNKDTGEFEKTGDTTWIDAALWGDLADSDIQKGDLVELDATLVDKVWEGKNGTGHTLTTDYIASITVKYRKAGTGF